jgi:hypothetical protein
MILNTLILFALGYKDTEAITHVAISKSKKYISVCERVTAGNKGKFSIYDITSSKLTLK